MSAERQIRILLRAWPLPDRSERGDEIVGTTLDLLPDGATRVPFLLALNLVVGGMNARWRRRPPVRILVRRIGRSALAIGMTMLAWVVMAVITGFILLKFDSRTVLCSFSPPAQSCSPPDQWVASLAFGIGFLGIATAAVLLMLGRRRRRRVRFQTDPP